SGSTVKVYDGTTQIGTAAAGTNGAWSFATAALTDGNHTFTSKAADAAGNVSGASAALKVTVDTVAPAKPNFIAYAPDGHVVSNGTSTNIDQFSLKGGALAGATIDVFDGATQIGTTTVGSDGTWSFATAALADGNHALAGSAMDTAGNHGALS